MTWRCDEMHIKLAILLDLSCHMDSYLRLGCKADGSPSGIAESEDIAMLGLGGNSEDVEDDREGDTELRDYISDR